MNVRERIRTNAFRALTAGLAATALAVGGAAAHADAASGVQRPDWAALFVQQINDDRAMYGHRTLAVTADLTSSAQRWAATMAHDNRLYHNPHLSTSVDGWCILGENVGVAYHLGELKHAFWQSAEHRANMLYGAYTRVGVGAFFDSQNRLWVAEEFERPC